jgi:hypothetical protein
MPRSFLPRVDARQQVDQPWSSLPYSARDTQPPQPGATARARQEAPRGGWGDWRCRGRGPTLEFEDPGKTGKTLPNARHAAFGVELLGMGGMGPTWQRVASYGESAELCPRRKPSQAGSDVTRLRKRPEPSRAC